MASILRVLILSFDIVSVITAVFLLATFAPTPFNVEPIAITFPDPPYAPLTGNLTVNSVLSGSTLVTAPRLKGPETITVSPSSSTESGLKVSMFGEQGLFYRFVGKRTENGYEMEQVGEPVECKYRTLVAVHEAGEEDFFITANVPLGLVRVEIRDGRCVQTVITDRVTESGERLYYADDFDVAEDGTVYIANSLDFPLDPEEFPGNKYYDDVLMDAFYINVLEGKQRGKIVKYSPQTNVTEVLRAGVFYPNGICLSHDESFLLYSENPYNRVMRLWLRGDRAGTVETFAVLPGLVDNVRRGSNGTYWVAVPSLNHALPILARFPRVRRLLAIMPKWTRMTAEPHTMIVRLDADGNVLQSLQDLTGRTRGVTSAVEHLGMLFMGSTFNEHFEFLEVPPLNEPPRGNIEASDKSEL